MVAAPLLVGLLLAAQAGQPVPQPFPKPGAPTTQAPPAQPQKPVAAAESSAEETPTEATLGVTIYPGAQFLGSFNAGRNQRFYLFGSSAEFTVLVTYYRTLLKQRGDLVYEVPATHQFDVGRFDNNTMAFPPGVTIKDFQSELSQGYPNPKPGGQPARFPTVIQIVAPPGK
jgi:hypothetical protein